MSFQWQTEEENEPVWEEPVAAPTGGGRARRPRWLVLVAILLLTATAAFLIYREGQQAVEGSVVRLEEAVLSSHELGQTALARADLELFSTVLSGRDPAWTAAQKERLEEGFLYGQTARALGLLPVDAPGDVAEITFSADLREATVTTNYSYRPPDPTVQEAITLAQTLVYRQGSDRWLLAPPDETGEFWGNWRTREGDWLKLTYPVRDEEIALKLAHDLEQKVVAICAQATCPPDFRARMRLERAPDSLLPLLDPENALTRRDTVVLPAPTLVGLPQSEAAYAALFRGYARQLLPPLLLQLDEWTCCDHVLYRQALLYHQLAALAVTPEPVVDVDYLFLPDQIPDREQLLAWWQEDEPVATPADIPLGLYAVVAFLREEAGSDLYTLQERFEGAVRGWVLGGRGARDEREEAWRAFVREKVEQAQQAISRPPALALPDQDLLLICRGDGATDSFASEFEVPSFLYRYRPATDTWTKEVDLGVGSMLLTVLPEDDGFFLARQRLGTEDTMAEIDTLLYGRGAAPIPLAADGERPIIPWPWFDPTGEQLLAWTVDLDAGSSGDVQFVLLDVAGCGAEGCPPMVIPGWPAWSPDGRQMVTMSFTTTERILLQNGQGSATGTTWQRVGRGTFPFWLDNQTYGFVGSRLSGDGEAGGIWLGESGQDRSPRRWLDEAQLRAAVPEEWSLTIDRAFAHPLAVNQFLVVAGTPRGQSELFVVGRKPAEAAWLDAEPVVRHLATLPAYPDGLPALSGMVQAGEPWLALPVHSENGIGLWVYDLRQEEPVLSSMSHRSYFHFYDWSADGQWLASDGALAPSLTAPGFEIAGRPYRRLLFHDYGPCSAVGWIDATVEIGS